MPLLLLSKLAYKYRDAMWALALVFALGLVQREHDAKVECQALIAAKPLVSAAVNLEVKKGPSRIKETERRFKRPAPPAVTAAKLEGALVSCPEVDVVEIERDIYTGPEESHSSNTRTETPLPPSQYARAAKWRVAGFRTNHRDIVDVHGGVTLYDRIDVIYGLGLRDGSARRHTLDFNWRW